MSTSDPVPPTSEGSASIVTHLSPSRGERISFRMSALLMLVTLVVFAAQAYLSGEALNAAQPLQLASHRIQNQLLQFHLELEERMAGDHTVQPQQLRRRLVDTLVQSNELQQLIDTDPLLVGAADRPALTQMVDSFRVALAELERGADRRLNQDSAVGSEDEQYFDQQFQRAFTITELMEREINEAVQRRIKLLQTFDIGIGLLLTLICLAAILIAGRVTQQRRHFNRHLEHAKLLLKIEEQRNERLNISLEMYRQTLMRSPQAVVITNADNRIIEINSAYTRMSGYWPDEVIGRNPNINKSEHHDESFYQQMWQAINEQRHWEGEVWDRRKDGSVYPKWLSIDAIHDAAGRLLNYIGTFTDLSQQKANEAEIQRLTYYDQLTQLPNRILFYHQLQHEIDVAHRHQQRLAVVAVNLDHFSEINDYYGFLIGDKLLRAVALRFTEALRRSDGVSRQDGGAEECRLSRVSGDTFSLLLPELGDRDDAAVVVRRLFNHLGEVFHIDGHQARLQASAGIAVYPNDGDEADRLLRQAERALARAKAEGGGCYRFQMTGHLPDESP